MRSAYDSIYFSLKESIENGTYGYKDLLPSESVLIKKYGCAHNTVRKALAILARDGYVQAIHGKGVRVIYRDEAERLAYTTYEISGIESMTATGRRHGFEVSCEVLLMEEVEVDEAFAQRTGFDVGTQLVHLERRRKFNGRYCEHEYNYFRADTVSGMTRADVERSVYDYIENVVGGKLVTSKRYLTLERADERDRELLDMADAVYMAVVESFTFDGEGMLCEWSVSRNHPDIFNVHYVAQRTRVNGPVD